MQRLPFTLNEAISQPGIVPPHLLVLGSAGRSSGIAIGAARFANLNAGVKTVTFSGRGLDEEPVSSEMQRVFETETRYGHSIDALISDPLAKSTFENAFNFAKNSQRDIEAEEAVGVIGNGMQAVRGVSYLSPMLPNHTIIPLSTGTQVENGTLQAALNAAWWADAAIVTRLFKGKEGDLKAIKAAYDPYASLKGGRFVDALRSI